MKVPGMAPLHLSVIFFFLAYRFVRPLLSGCLFLLGTSVSARGGQGSVLQLADSERTPQAGKRVCTEWLITHANSWRSCGGNWVMVCSGSNDTLTSPNWEFFYTLEG